MHDGKLGWRRKIDLLTSEKKNATKQNSMINVKSILENNLN